MLIFERARCMIYGTMHKKIDLGLSKAICDRTNGRQGIRIRYHRHRVTRSNGMIEMIGDEHFLVILVRSQKIQNIRKINIYISRIRNSGYFIIN